MMSLSSQGQSLSVKASSSSSSSSSLVLSPGNALALICSVSADNLPSLALEVSWLADGRDIITMERSGVVISNTTIGGTQGKRGDANLERTGSGKYRLLITGVSGEDGGGYACRVRAFIEKGKSAGGGGRWHMAAEKTSSPLLVKVEQTSEYFFTFKLIRPLGFLTLQLFLTRTVSRIHTLANYFITFFNQSGFLSSIAEIHCGVRVRLKEFPEENAKIRVLVGWKEELGSRECLCVWKMYFVTVPQSDGS